MEMLDLIDENGNLIGEQKERKEIHKNGLFHHASGVIILSRLSKASGGGTRFSHNKDLIRKRKMLGFGICQQVGMLMLEKVHCNRY